MISRTKFAIDQVFGNIAEKHDNLFTLKIFCDDLRPLEDASKPRENIILDGLHCSPTLQSLLTHVSSEPALLNSSEWNIRTEHCPRIHSDLSRLDGFGNAMGATNIVGENSRTETVMRIVGLEDHFFFRGKLGDTLADKMR